MKHYVNIAWAALVAVIAAALYATGNAEAAVLIAPLAAAELEREIHRIRIERMVAEPYDVQTYGDVWRFWVKAEDDPDPRGDIQVWIDAADREMVYFQDARDYYRSTAPQSRSMWRKRLPLRISGNEARVRMS